MAVPPSLLLSMQSRLRDGRRRHGSSPPFIINTRHDLLFFCFGVVQEHVPHIGYTLLPCTATMETLEPPNSVI